MAFMRQARWAAKFRWHDAEKFGRNTSACGICTEFSTKGELNYENIYPSAWSGCDARFGFVRVGGAGHDHNDHDARDNHGGAADSDTTDYDYLQRGPLIASLSLAERAACSRALCCIRRRSKDLAPQEFSPASPGNAVPCAVFSGL